MPTEEVMRNEEVGRIAALVGNPTRGRVALPTGCPAVVREKEPPRVKIPCPPKMMCGLCRNY